VAKEHKPHLVIQHIDEFGQERPRPDWYEDAAPEALREARERYERDKKWRLKKNQEAAVAHGVQDSAVVLDQIYGDDSEASSVAPSVCTNPMMADLSRPHIELKRAVTTDEDAIGQTNPMAGDQKVNAWQQGRLRFDEHQRGGVTSGILSKSASRKGLI
jgi:hypothetical protein